MATTHSNPQSKQGPDEPDSTLKRSLSLFDCICIIIGTIIGAGIFRTPSTLASTVPSEAMFFLVWAIGGIIAIIGALCFAELTTCYPDRGGDYGYLKRAFGQWVGFAFAWAAFWVIRPGNISVMAIVFGTFARDAFTPALSKLAYALIALAIISGINLLGMREGKWSQNVLAVAKVAGILLILLSAVFLSPAEEPSSDTKSDVAVASEQVAQTEAKNDDSAAPADEESQDKSFEWFWLSLVFVMFTFGGWNDIAFVATEVRNPKKNLLYSLVLGVLGVLAIYLLFNFALIHGLGFDRLGSYENGVNAPTEFVALRLGGIAGRLLALLVCVSCVGAISAMIFTSPRIYWATAEDYSGLAWLTGKENGWRRPMVLQTIVTIIFVWVFGRFDESSFDLLVVASAPYFWSFLGLTVVALVVLRQAPPPETDTGFRVPGYPILPLIFVLACAFMTYRSYDYMIFKGFGIHAAVIAGWIAIGIGASLALRTASNQSPKKQE